MLLQTVQVPAVWSHQFPHLQRAIAVQAVTMLSHVLFLQEEIAVMEILAGLVTPVQQLEREDFQPRTLVQDP